MYMCIYVYMIYSVYMYIYIYMIYYVYIYCIHIDICKRGRPGGSMVKNLLANAGDAGSIPESGRSSVEGTGNPLQYSCLKCYGQRTLADYSPRGHKESDTT